ncbi:MAG TPA: PspC domain-containing protein [Candidatus Paceibacterota bacterium]|nr:PspC domain-containing protein [Candidatus Paceibacterota bacterium]
MEKITQISINSVLFALEESAYNKLSFYLEEIRSAFADETGGQEILKDIEARIAEHLKNRSEAVISIKAVDEVIATMGTVAELTGQTETSTSKAKKVTSASAQAERRLYRDEDRAILGGVCAGIAAYLEVDPTWVRIAFVILMFFGFGLIIPIYIILWLIVPPASTTAEKLEMHGNPVTLHTIVDTVRERAHDLYGEKSAKDGTAKETTHKEDKGEHIRMRIHTVAARIAQVCGTSIRMIVGIVLSLIGLGMIIGSAAGTTALLSVDKAKEVGDFIAYANAAPFLNIAIAALALLIAIPGLFILFGGINVLRRKAVVQIRYGLAIFGIWMLALTVIVILGTHFGIRYAEFAGKSRNNVQVTISQGTLVPPPAPLPPSGDAGEITIAPAL